MSERILVTGGAGFIGSRLVRALLAEGHKVWVLDSLLAQVHGEGASFPAIPGEVVWRKGDVARAADIRSIVAEAEPTRVFHLAAETGTGQSLDEVARYCDVNVMGTAHLVEALRTLKGIAPRIILSSTRAVYGEGAWLGPDGRMVVPPARLLADMQAGHFAPMVDGSPLTTPIPTPETAQPAPASIYASTKLMQEHMLRQVCQASGWGLAILRFQNVYGPGQSLKNPYTGVLSVFIQSLLGGQGIGVYEDGDITRDFVFVDDVVRALVLAGNRPSLDPEPINIGTGVGATILQAAQLLASHARRNDDAIRINGAFRAGDIRHAVADIKRAKDLLGWEPHVFLPEGTAALVEWARESL